MENQRDKEKPFCILIHHKAQHRNWMADTCNLALYEDKTFPIPETYYDDYKGRKAAAAQEMSIIKDMDLVYDLKSGFETSLFGNVGKNGFRTTCCLGQVLRPNH